MRVQNIRLNADYKAVKMRLGLWEGNNREQEGDKIDADPQQLAAYRILQEQNQKLK